MNNKLFRNGFVFGIIFLFIGIVVQPISSIEITNDYIIPVNEVNVTNEDDCGCRKIDVKTLDSLDRTLDKLKFHIKMLLALLRVHLESIEKIKELLSEISKLIEQLENFNLDSSQPYELICDIIYGISYQIALISDYFYEQAIKYPYGSFLNALFWQLAIIFALPSAALYGIWIFFCS
jgi:hypothetical protein